MNTINKSMLLFNSAELPLLPVVKLNPFANTYATEISELPHTVIELTDTRTAERKHLFIHFSDITADSRVHDQAKIVGLLDEWLERLVTRLNKDTGAHPHYELVGGVSNFDGFSPMAGHQRWPGNGWPVGPGAWPQAPVGMGWNDARRPAAGYNPGGLYPNQSFHEAPGRMANAEEGVFGAGTLSSNIQDAKAAYVRNIVAQQLLGAINQHATSRPGPRLNVLMDVDRKHNESGLYIEGSMGNGVTVTLRREVAARREKEWERQSDYGVYAATLDSVTGSVKLAGENYLFWFKHELLGAYFPRAISTLPLREGFERLWSQFSGLAFGDTLKFEMIFNECD
jgi:hypothetical protein